MFTNGCTLTDVLPSYIIYERPFYKLFGFQNVTIECVEMKKCYIKTGFSR